MLIPLRTKNPPERIPFITYTLILINVLAYIGTTVYGLYISDRMLEVGALSYVHQEPHRWITSMFLHGGLLHIIGNMLFLWIFGCAVEGRLGYLKYFLLYFIGGIAGSFLHLLFSGPNNPEVWGIGASGAIMAVVGAAMYIFPFAPVTFFYLMFYRIGTFDWVLWGAATYYLFWDVLGVMMSNGGTAKGGGTANLAHLGGAGAGFLIVFALRTKRDSAYVSEAKAQVHEAKDYSVLSRSELTSLLETQPENAEILLALLVRCTRDNFKIDPAHIEKFKTDLPKLLHNDKISIEQISTLTMQLSHPPGTFSPKLLQLVSDKLEKAGKPQPAFEFLNRVAQDPNAKQEDWEVSLYKMGLIRESWFQDYAGAKHFYDLFMTHYSLSPMATIVSERQKVVNQKLAALPPAP